MKEPPAIKKTHVYLPLALHARLQEVARQDRRSLNSEIVWLLEQALEAREKGKPDAPR